MKSTHDAWQLWPRDAAWVYLEEPSTPALTIPIYVFDTSHLREQLKADEVISFLSGRLRCFELATRRLRRSPLDIAHPTWVRDPTFDIRNHVTVSDGAGRGWPAVAHAAASFAAEALNLHRPPWQMHVITGLHNICGARRVAVVLIKFHHSVGDGFTTLQIARRLLGADDSVARLAKRPTPRGPWSFPIQLVEFGRGVITSLRAARRATAELAAGKYVPPTRRRPLTRFNDRVSQERSFDAATFPLCDVLALRALIPDATVNDLALAVISGALREYLWAAGELPDTSLGAMVPMSLRASRGLRSANQFAALHVDLHTNLDDAIARIRAIHDAVAGERERATSDPVRRAESLVDSTPGTVVRVGSWFAARVQMNSQTLPIPNVAVTNVARGKADMRLCGAPVIATYGAPALSVHQGLTHGVHSIGDMLSISVLADPGMMPDVGRYVHLIEEKFKELTEAAKERTG